MCEPEEINERWCDAVSHPIEPEIVGSGAVHEVVIAGDELDRSGLEQMAVPCRDTGIWWGYPNHNAGDYTGYVDEGTTVQLWKSAV